MAAVVASFVLGRAEISTQLSFDTMVRTMVVRHQTRHLRQQEK